MVKLRRMLGIRSPSGEYEAAGRELLARQAAGLNDPRPLTADEMGEMLAYAEGVTRRAFPELHEDEDE